MSELIFHHTGIVCQSIEDEIPIYEDLGYIQIGEEIKDKRQNIRGLFMEHSGSIIQLLESLDEDLPTHPVLSRGPQMCHQSFQCDGIKDASLYFIEKGAIEVLGPKPSRVFVGRFTAFLMLPNKMLIELIGPI